MANQDTPESLKTVLDKRKSLERHVPLLTELAEEAIAHPSEECSDCEQIVQLLESLHADVEDLLGLKTQWRFFDDIVDLAPHLETTVERLRGDHEELLANLDTMRADVTQGGPLPHVGRLLNGWLTRFRELDTREIDLIQKVWNVDVGTLD